MTPHPSPSSAPPCPADRPESSANIGVQREQLERSIWQWGRGDTPDPKRQPHPHEPPVVAAEPAEAGPQ